jgi:single-stranded-DNA-specific exonuclease
LELDRLGPFGQKNERPVFASTKVELAQPPSTMGEGGLHLSITVKQHNTTIRAIAFGKGEWAAEMEQVDGPISICYAASINRFRGRETVQLQLIDWQADSLQPESASVSDTQSESTPS